MSLHGASARDLAARLRQRITLEQPVESPDGSGGTVRSWSTLASVWAEILPLRGNEVLQQEQLHSVVTHRVTIRYRADVTAAMRVVFEGRSFNILSVVNVSEAKVITEILAEEGGAI